MNPYMSTLLRPLTEVLHSFSSSPKTGSTAFALWSGVVITLTKSLEADDGGTSTAHSRRARPDPLYSLLA